MNELKSDFLAEAAENLAIIDDELVKLAAAPSDKGALQRIFRLIHTIKGSSRFVALPRVETLAHAAEGVLARFRDNATGVTLEAFAAIHQSLDRIKALLAEIERVEIAGELAATRDQLLERARNSKDLEFKGSLQRLSDVATGLVCAAQGLAAELGKQVDLRMEGADIEVDRLIVDQLKHPLMHLIRNAIDHGVETPAERSAMGKPAAGTITLRAFQDDGHIVVEIADDGRGLATDKIKAQVIARRLVGAGEAARLSETQIHTHIFQAGLSTAARVTPISGHGVGLDVVRSNIELAGGHVDVTSKAGQGTTFAIWLPLNNVLTRDPPVPAERAFRRRQ